MQSQTNKQAPKATLNEQLTETTLEVKSRRFNIEDVNAAENLKIKGV
ncbi:MAG TPA: hypothetical protein VLZ33_05800 [Dysgonamonadaceae bacterium]|nr:hypothetical protein [Dysgonamonadaceae bacterium]